MIKILIIDDERDIRALLKTRLEKICQCWIDCSSSAEDALTHLKRKQYDIIFIDYMLLGERDGFDFLYSVKKRHEKSMTVMMSGYMDSMDKVKKQGLGIMPDAFMPKPFPKGKLDEIMSEYMAKHKEQH